MKAPLRQLAIITRPEAEEAVADALAAEFGEIPCLTTDLATGRVTAALFQAVPDARVTSTRARLRAVVARVRQAGGDPGPARLVVRRVPPRDWSESWKRHFRPIDLGGILLVKPGWSRRKPRAGQAVVQLDPGLSFGTGQHPTTHFCLEQVVRCRPRKGAASFLDVGTGSGILALAAARLGYDPVEALDFDPDCVRVARENAVLNGVGDRVVPQLADITRVPRRPRRTFDVVAANLIHDLLVAERDRITARVKPGGSLILAGILVPQFPAVAAAYAEAGWRCVRARTVGEWRSGLFRRPGASGAGLPAVPGG